MAPATSWPATTSSDVLAGKGAEGAQVGQALFDRLIVAQQSGVGVYFSVNTTAASFTSLYEFTMRVPLWVRGSNYFRMSAWVYVAGGSSPTGHFRIVRNGSTQGTDVSTSLTTPGDVLTSEIDIPDNTWAGAEIDFDVEGYCTGGGTVYIHAERLLMNVRMGD